MPSDCSVPECSGGTYTKLPSSSLRSSRQSSRSFPETPRIFDVLPRISIVSVSRPDAADISPFSLTYTIELQYKQFEWRLVKKATQVIYLHLALKKRAIIDDFQEKQGHVKEWLQNLGIGENIKVVQHEDEADDDSIHIEHDESYTLNYRDVPSAAAFPIFRPELGRQHSITDRAKVAMQGYLNHFIGNLDVVNSPEVCKFLEVSRLSFLPEYGRKLKEGYVLVRQSNDEDKGRCCSCTSFFNCCVGGWQKVWAVLKPGFLALLEDPFCTKLLDIIMFDVLPPSEGNDASQIYLSKETKECNPFRFGFTVSCGSHYIKLRTKSKSKVKDWVAAINDAGLRTPEGWCYSHRFDSFAPPRGLTEDGSEVQWFIDGRSAFEAIASSIEEAKSEIFIADWWLCPELYLRRPFRDHEFSVLEVLLERKAKQGVQIYILLYKEVSVALSINSIYSKRRLRNIHENVKVLRYPDHFSAGVLLWSHHEKIVVVDNRVCYLGGLDLCFGRYDTSEHKVADFPPLIWPGKDYYNPRESEPNSWEDTVKDELDREKYPRMPWHDVQCAMWGPPCRDVARHFVQRWNYAKRNKAPNEPKIPLLMPQDNVVIPCYMGTERERESSSQDRGNIPLLLSQEPDSPSSKNGKSKMKGPDEKHSQADNVHRNNQSSLISFRKTKAEHLFANKKMTGSVDDLGPTQSDCDKSLDAISQPLTSNIGKEWWESQEWGDQIVFAEESREVGCRVPCSCQVIRSVDQWSAGTSQTEESIHNAYISLIEKSEHLIYIENQFFISGRSSDDVICNRVLEALYCRIVRAYKENKTFRVIAVIPLLPGFQGSVDDAGAASVRTIMHWQYRTICRGPNSILQNLYEIMGPKSNDYISFYGLRSYGRLHDGGPLATSQVYVHSKLMIIDDRFVVIGSANINDRSLLGSRDSEIGVVIEDKEFVSSFMNGKPWEAGKFALSLRLSLWSEHLGLRLGESSRIKDPVNDRTYKEIWMATAKTNTTIFQDVFSCVPNDLIHTRSALRESTAYWKEKVGYTTNDLGIAPEKLESYEDGDVKHADPMERLKLIKGHLVSFPLDFMCDEDLRPGFNESEYYASQVYH